MFPFTWWARKSNSFLIKYSIMKLIFNWSTIFCSDFSCKEILNPYLYYQPPQYQLEIYLFCSSQSWAMKTEERSITLLLASESPIFFMKYSSWNILHEIFFMKVQHSSWNLKISYQIFRKQCSWGETCFYSNFLSNLRFPVPRKTTFPCYISLKVLCLFPSFYYYSCLCEILCWIY